MPLSYPLSNYEDHLLFLLPKSAKHGSLAGCCCEPSCNSKLRKLARSCHQLGRLPKRWCKIPAEKLRTGTSRSMSKANLNPGFPEPPRCLKRPLEVQGYLLTIPNQGVLAGAFSRKWPWELKAPLIPRLPPNPQRLVVTVFGRSAWSPTFALTNQELTSATHKNKNNLYLKLFRTTASCNTHTQHTTLYTEEQHFKTIHVLFIATGNSSSSSPSLLSSTPSMPSGSSSTRLQPDSLALRNWGHSARSEEELIASKSSSERKSKVLNGKSTLV